MLYSDVTAYFIILATAVTLNVTGVKDIETAAQAAASGHRLCWQLRIPALRSRYSWCWNDWRSSTRRLRWLRPFGGHGMEMGS